MLRVERLHSAGEFLSATRDLLGTHELEWGLKLGLARLLSANPQVGAKAWLLVVRNGGEVRGCALQTPPRSLVISELDEETAEALCRALVDWGARFPAVHGPVGAVERFAAAWARCAGVVPRRQLSLRLFCLERVSHAPRAPGRMRAARPRDEGLVVHWFRAFRDEAIPSDPVDPVAVARHALDGKRVFVWDFQGPVCMAALGRELPSNTSIGPVYTPPEHRGRGYASALVAALSQRVLDSGKRHACLFTDLSNPVSNRIYPRIGFVPIRDFAEIAFSQA